MAFAFVQQVTANNTASGTSLASAAAATTAGNHLFVHLRWETADTTVTVTDSAGNTYTALTASKSGQGAHSQWFYCLNALGSASNVITVTWAAAQGYRSLRLMEFSATSPSIEQLVSTVQASGTTSFSSSAFNTAGAGLVLVGLSQYNGETSINFGATYTALANAFNYSKEAYQITTGALTNEVVTYTGSTTTTRAMDVLTLTEGGGGGTNVAVNPSVGTVAISGYAPAIGQTANQSVSPGAGSVAISGYAPSVAQSANVSVSPSVGTIAITGYAPSVALTANVSLAPSVGTMAITGYAPTVTSASNVTINPGQGALGLTGYAPSIKQAVNNVPPLPLATIMRASPLAMKGGALSATAALSAGTIASKMALATIMRAQATSRTAPIHSDPINLTVGFP